METLPAILFTLFLCYLAAEAAVLQRRRKQISVRIAVTGTRGKSSVVRSLAAVCRHAGQKVFGKTTGSEALYHLPDGGIRPVRRRGLPSIIEQEKTVRFAAAADADTLIAEIMSIHPENHAVESRMILRPHIIVITNIRHDHTDAMGNSRDDIAAVLAGTIPHKAVVFIPEQEMCDPILQTVKQRDCRLIPVPFSGEKTDPGRQPEGQYEFNRDLVYAVARHLGIEESQITAGIAAMGRNPDEEEIRVITGRGKKIYVINAFAANDPESTFMVLERVKSRLSAASGNITGLLSLRGDRAERTAQWLDILAGGRKNPFQSLYVTGRHARIFPRRIPGCRVLGVKDPGLTTDRLLTDVEDGGIVFGFGNMAGAGEQLTAHWLSAGEAYGR